MNLQINLNKDFERFFDKLKEEYGEDFVELNGLDEAHLSPTNFLDLFVKYTTVADASVDGNSNINQKDIVTLRSEKSKSQEKLMSYFKIFLELKQKYGLRHAKKWLELEWNKALYMHDANTANLISYCFAYDLTKMVEEGLYWLPDHKKSEPAKHLETFVDFVKEFISFTSNRTSGAVGLPNLIPYMYWYWKKDCENGIHGLMVTQPEQFAKSQIQRLIYAMNQPYCRDGVQSAFINTSIFDSEYFDALFGGMIFPDGTLAIDEKDEIMLFQKWFLEEMRAIKDNGKMFTFPVNTISLLYKDGKFVDEEFAKWASNHNRKWNDSNIFCDSSVNSLSNCCRLKSSIEDLGYFNSIGGSALKVGSIKVSTLNLARIAYESKGKQEKYIDILKDRLLINLEALDVVRDIIKKNVDRGLLPNFNEGMLDFEHLYNTVGVNGIYETMRTFGYTETDEFGYTKYKPEAFKFGELILKTIQEINAEFAQDKNYRINVEQVPGEQAAAKFLKADSLLYPTAVVKDLPLYGNQWIPLGIKATLKDRIEICAAFDKYCSGGSIMHCNIDAPFATEEQAWEMLNYIANKGVTYFAFNGKLSSDDNGHLFYGDICPDCGAPKTAEFTRTVGFFTKTAGWSKERKEEFKLREWMPLNSKGIDA
jgi:ribonucleoside-triphosphate reductase